MALGDSYLHEKPIRQVTTREAPVPKWYSRDLSHAVEVH